MAEWLQCTHMDGTPALDKWARIGIWHLSVTPMDGRWNWYADEDKGRRLHGDAPTEEAAKAMAEAVAMNVNPEPGESDDGSQ